MKAKLKASKTKNGQSLWEVIVALTIVGLIAMGLVRASGSSIKSTRFSTYQSKMTALAQEKIAKIIDYKNKHYQEFWGAGYPALPPEIPATEHNEGEDYCLLTTLADDSINFPTETPHWIQAKMVRITVKVFWEEKGNGEQCDNHDFNHVLVFETNVTN